jgi:replication-associated recombination protein RarA
MNDSLALDSIENPAWVLDVPVVDQITPPVDTRAQVLPFGDLSWQDFERLCLRLAKSDGDAEYWRVSVERPVKNKVASISTSAARARLSMLPGKASATKHSPLQR